MNDWIVVKNRDTSRSFEISNREAELRIDGRAHPIDDHVHHKLLLLLVTDDTRWVTYKQIADAVRSVKASQYMQGSVDSAIASKHIHSLGRTLKKHNIIAVHENVRGKGYRLHDRWAIVSVETQTNKADDIEARFLSDINAIIERCITCCRSTGLIDSESGFKYITPSQKELLEIFTDLDDCYRRFIEDFSRPGNSANLIHVRDRLIELLSYCVFWRVGDGLTDDKWKSDYENEIRVLYSRIQSELSTLLTSFTVESE